MHGKAATIFYGLCSFVLFTALFAIQNPSTPQVAAWQDNIQHNFAVSLVQTIGDQPVFDGLELVFDSTVQFYQQMADNALAMVQDPSADRDLVIIYKQVYLNFAAAFHKPSPSMAQTQPPAIAGQSFMMQEPIYNIVPPQSALRETGEVLGLSIEPVNDQTPWVTMRDNMTNQLYCIALYNGEVNKYLGTCKHDYR